jgi:hypothetical protein
LAVARQRAFGLAAEQLRELVPRALEVVQHQLDSDNYQAAIRVLRLARLDRHDLPPASATVSMPNP